MVVDTTLHVKVIIKKRSNEAVWPYDSEVIFGIEYVSDNLDPLQAWFNAEDLFAVVLAMGITEDTPIAFPIDDHGNVFMGDTMIDENGKEWHAPKRNVLERLDAPVKTITPEEAGWE